MRSLCYAELILQKKLLRALNDAPQKLPAPHKKEHYKKAGICVKQEAGLFIMLFYLHSNSTFMMFYAFISIALRW